MTDTTQEPTMEEILASIRRIISEDEPGAEAASSDVHAAPHGDAEADVLELTHKVEATNGGDLGGVTEPAFKDEAEKTETVGDLDVFDAAPTPAHQTSAAPAKPAPTSGSPMSSPTLVSEPAASAAASRFSALEQTVQLDQGVVAPSTQTLDQVVKEMLNPMLKAWLDQHLESIVEAKVQAEVERISRRR